ncbi:MAG: hypothetical protein U1E65_16865 [Myxococcota bacterium]
MTPRSIGIAALALLCLIACWWWVPRLVYRAREARPLEVAIVDKTVPFRNYREHHNLNWLLHAWKRPPGSGQHLDPARDYLGFDPIPRRGEDFHRLDVLGKDLIFIADTYGVYVKDYEKPGDVAALERSPKIYGGLTSTEAGALLDAARSGALVIGEFNSFASPTTAPVRAEMERFFGVRWTHWVMRFWPDLQDENEVPKWVGRVYRRVYHREFDLVGPGLVMVRDDEDMVVLQPPQDISKVVLSLVKTTTRADWSDLPDEAHYLYWIDLLEPAGGEVLYEHRIEATERGAAILAEHKIPLRFPALVQNQRAYYLAGDCVDTAIELGDPERAGTLWWRRWFAHGSPEQRFFWGFYAPVLERIVSGQ